MIVICLKNSLFDLCWSVKITSSIRKLDNCDFVTASILFRSIWWWWTRISRDETKHTVAVRSSPRSVCPDMISNVSLYSSHGISLHSNKGNRSQQLGSPRRSSAARTHSTLLLYHVLLILSLQKDTVASVIFPLVIAPALPAPCCAMPLFPLPLAPVAVVLVVALYISSTLLSTMESSSWGAGLMHGSVIPKTSRAPGWMFPKARWNRIVLITAPMQFFAIDRSQVYEDTESYFSAYDHWRRTGSRAYETRFELVRHASASSRCGVNMRRCTRSGGRDGESKWQSGHAF